ncbi:Cna B domain-containing protein [Candidatus Sulfotelmatomonas gaucii]|uniref:Cna B domain-containing protein n=1 Tax=Candidatus Sulfuritelmatomonas gaucii TaxID=2043161 RepID=A0A2N9L4W1_9BACT|nr:Cna B domain-containing protein [Candidatus Sulfotelmatomonas gaucii]
MKVASFFAFATLLGACVLGAWGQSTASISGTVTDPSGAVIPNAQVTIHSLATGLDRVVSTDSAGLYAVPSLIPGDYKVQATARGFSSYTVPKVTLDVDRQVTENMRLAVSSAGETIQVQSAVQQIEAQTITVGQVIDNTAVQELPLNGRHFLDLTVLTPGGVVADAAGSLTAASRGLGANSFITAGNREDSVNFQINGINLNDISQNQITFQPSISTTSEFKINNSTFSAEYGRSDGSIVTVATRSGTDRFHGEAFDYFRNEALDARNYFNRPFNPGTGLPLVANTGDKAPLKRDNFGGSVGGPIWKGHTFFFGSYEGLRQHQGILQNSQVITQANQNAIAANKSAEPIAAALAALIPLPNSGTTNYVSFTPGPVNIDQYTGDVLQQFSSSDSLHGFYAFQNDIRTEPSLQGDTISGWGDHRHAHRQIGTLGETHIFSPSVVNETRLGFNRIFITFNPANTIDPTSVGLGDGLSGKVGIPQTTLSDIGLVFGGPAGFPQGRTDTTGVLSDTVSMLKGKHTLKWGGEFRRYLVASFTGNIGTLTFTTSTTPTSLFQTDQATVFAIQPNIVSSRIYADSTAGFVQDNYKVAHNLTLEGGLRFEWNGTPVEGANRFTIFNPATVTLTRVGTNGLAANAAYKENYNFEPRVGFAWDLFGTGKTVLRGGYAYLVDQPVSGVVTGMASNPPFSTAVSYNSATPIPLSSLYASAKASGISLYGVNPNYKNAYIESFNLNWQQALPWGMVAQLYYDGSVGRHLEVESNINQVVGATSAVQVHPFTALAATSPVAPGGAIASNIGYRTSNSYSDYNAMWAVLSKNMSNGLELKMSYTWTKSMDLNSLGSQGGLTLPDSTNPSENYGLSDFDVRQHFGGTAIYELPFHKNELVRGYRLIGIMQYQTGNPVNIVAGSSSFNGVTGLPRPTQVGPVVRKKQQLAGIGNVTLFQSAGLAYNGTVCDITNYTSACSLEIQGTQASATGTTAPTVYTGLGTMQRNAFTGPGFADLDMSGEKETKIFENLSFTLRADAFDILNHPNFGQPSGNVQSTSFGQITATRFATSDGGSSRQLQISGKFTF